jgi:hypothetical protein
MDHVMFKTTAYLLAVAFIACCAITSSRAETPEEWVALGTRVHGFFGGFRLMAVVVIRDRKTGEGLRYNISDEWLPKMLAWNKDDPLKRYDEVMTADGLFTVEHLAPR